MSGGKASQGTPLNRTPEKPHHERNTTASFVDDGNNNNNNNNSNIAITELLNSHPSSDTVSSSVLSGGGIVGQKKKGSKRGGAIRKIFRKIIDPLSNKKSGRSDDHDDPDDDMFGLPVLGDAPVSTKYGAGNNSKRKLGSVHSLVGFDVSDSDGAGVGGGGGKAAKRLGSSNSRLSNSSMAEVGLPPPTARFRWVPGMHRNNNNNRNQQQQGYHPFVLAALNRYQHMVAMNNTQQQQQQQQQMRYMQTMTGGATRQAQQGPYTAHASSGGGGGSQTAQGGLAGTEPGGYDDYHAGEYGGQGGGYYGTNTVDDILTGRGGEYNSSPATIDNNMGGEESTSGPYLPSDVQSFYGPIGVEGRAAAKRRKAMEAKGETAGMDFQTLMSSCWCNPDILTQARWVKTPPMHLLEDWEGDDGGGGVSDGENISDVYPNRTNGSNNNKNTPQMFNHVSGQGHGEANTYAANAQPGGVGRSPPPRFTATCATQQPFGAAGTAGRQPKAPPQQQQQQQPQPGYTGEESTLYPLCVSDSDSASDSDEAATCGYRLHSPAAGEGGARRTGSGRELSCSSSSSSGSTASTTTGSSDEEDDSAEFPSSLELGDEQRARDDFGANSIMVGGGGGGGDDELHRVPSMGGTADYQLDRSLFACGGGDGQPPSHAQALGGSFIHGVVAAQSAASEGHTPAPSSSSHAKPHTPGDRASPKGGARASQRRDTNDLFLGCYDSFSAMVGIHGTTEDEYTPMVAMSSTGKARQRSGSGKQSFNSSRNEGSVRTAPSRVSASPTPTPTPTQPKPPAVGSSKTNNRALPASAPTNTSVHLPALPATKTVTTPSTALAAPARRGTAPTTPSPSQNVKVATPAPPSKPKAVPVNKANNNNNKNNSSVKSNPTPPSAKQQLPSIGKN